MIRFSMRTDKCTFEIIFVKEDGDDCKDLQAKVCA